MTYELAKKLKDSGFPQNTEFYHEEFDDVDNRRYHRPHHLYGIRLGDFPSEKQGLIADPNLSELIEACGDRFNTLNRCDDFWEAFEYTDEESSKGQTPEIAVANLWLGLNKK